VRREPSKPVASKTLKVDDGRDESFSKADAEDELGVASRGKSVMVVVAGLLIVTVGAFVAFKRNGRRSLDQEREAKEHVQVPAPAKPTGPSIEPLGRTQVAQTGAKPAPVDALGVAARKPAAPLGAAREELDERSADPRMARERVNEARPLLALCRMAFDQHRMRDAEGACTAARDANPESADAHALLAHSLYNRNKKREALASAERAVKLNPKLADAYVIIGGVRQEDGDVDDARRAYQRYLELEPKGSFAADLRAIINRLPAKL
jgi:Tfp pilus assembly protein PilF